MIRRPGLGLVALLWFAALGASASAAGGPGGRVVLVAAEQGAGALADEVMARTRGELRAARFVVELATAPSAVSGRMAVEREARRSGAVAALAVFFVGNTAEIWVANAAEGRTTVQTFALEDAPPARRAAILAAKAVDLLKATLAELPAGGEPPPVAEKPAPPPPMEPPPSEPPPAASTTIVRGRSPLAPPSIEEELPDAWRGFALGAGGGWLRAGDRGTFAPAVSVALHGAIWAGRLTVSGLGTASTWSAAAGSARVSSELAVAELLACGRYRLRYLRWCAALGGGAQRLSVDGTGTAGFEGVSPRVWSGVASAGAGAVLDLGRHILATLDARAVGSWPDTHVRIDGQSVAHVGAFGAWVSAGVGAYF
jgi:hypothetical protein